MRFLLRFCALALFIPGVAGALLADGPATLEFSETFTGDPAARGWQIHGHASAFRWNPEAARLDVTWDSRRPNAFFAHALGTELNRFDDFRFSVQLRLEEIRSGVNPEKPGPFQLAVGLLNLAAATNANFTRGNLRSPHLVEFNYFPAGEFPDFGAVEPTVSTIMVSSNRQPVAGFTFPLELPLAIPITVEMIYSASNQTLRTWVKTNDVEITTIPPITLPASFTNFRLTHFSISSYSDAGDPYDSLLARGSIEKAHWTVPEPPAWMLRAVQAEGARQIEFMAQTNWLIGLEVSSNLLEWSPATAMIPTSNGVMRLTVPAGTGNDSATLFRIQARKP